MKKYSYRFNISRYFILLFYGFVLLINSCKKPEVFHEIPLIEFLTDSGYVYCDTTLPMGTLMKFKVLVKDQIVPITNFVISYNNFSTSNNNEQYFLDTGIYIREFSYEIEIIKGTSAHERWTFSVMNKERFKVSATVNINLASGGSFGNIKEYNVSLGAQNNTQTGQFFSFTTEQVSNLEGAYNNQSTTDLAYYFHSIYESTLSSPNDNDAPSIFTGQYGVSNWQIKNESRYNLTNLTISDFDNALNDSLLIASYDVVNAKRKGKNIVVGQVWAFRIQSGKIGLMKIDGITPDTDGKVDLSIKIQE